MRRMYFVNKHLAQTRGPISLILEGAFFVLLGLVLCLANLNNTGQIKKVTGYIQDQYVHSHFDGTGYVYDDTYLQINAGDGLYIFNHDDFHPKWDESKVVKGEKVDIFFEDDEHPYKVVAIQLYDISGGAASKFTTADYEANPSTYQKAGISPMIGLWIMLFGLLIGAFGGWRVYRYQRDRRIEQEPDLSDTGARLRAISLKIGQQNFCCLVLCHILPQMKKLEIP